MWYSGIANLYSEKNDFNQAFEFSTKALKIRRDHLCPNHPLIAVNLHNLGCIRHQQGQYYRALGFYKKAQELFEQTTTQNQINLASIYSSLSSLYLEKNECELALEYSTKSLNIKRKLLDEKHLSISASEVNLGRIHARLRNYKEAFDCYNRALENTDNMGEIYVNLGDLHSFQNEHTIAMNFYDNALIFYKEKYGDNHSCTAKTYSAIGNAFYSLDNNDKAMENYALALKIAQKMYPEDHCDIAVILNNIANILSDTGEIELAIGVYLQAVVIYRNHFNETHPEALITRENIAHCYKAMASNCVGKEKWQDALEFCQDALEIYENILPLGSTNRESTLESLKNDMKQLRDLIT